MSGQRVHESASLGTPGPDASSGRMLVQVISAGVGSSGYYSPEVLREAADKRLIQRGTPLFLDHASEAELQDRPERSVRDIAAVFADNATYDAESQALVGEVQVFAPYRELLTEMAEHIGLSIMGSATDVSEGEVAGRRVPVVEGLAAIDSVDFVTRAGRGGRVLQLLESARGDAFTADTARMQLAESRNVGQWMEARLHLHFTQIADDMFGDGHLTREERIALSGAVGEALDAFTGSLEGSAPDLYQRDLWEDPESMLVESEPHRQDVPTTRSGGKEITQEEDMPEIAESELRNLREAAGRVTTLESERDAAVREREVAESERDEARSSLAEVRRENAAREIIESADAEFTRLEIRGLLADLPVTESGDLDSDAFTERVTEAATEVAARESAGIVRGFGGGSGGGTTLTEADVDNAIGGAFGRTQSLQGA